MAQDLDLGKCLEFAKALTLEAGKVVQHGFENEKTICSKDHDKDIVTEYDNKVEDFMINELTKEYPGHKFLAEESTYENKIDPELTDSPTWILDPIDGTMNYAHSYPEACISLALAVSGEVVLGIIYNPMHSELYTAVKGGGAFLNGKPIRTSGATELKKALVMTDPFVMIIPSKIRDLLQARFEALLTVSQGLRSIGCAAMSLAYLARGSVDCFHIEFMKPWDVAAGMLIVREAGGTVIDTKGGEYNVMKPKTIAAATKELAEETSKLIVDTDLKAQRKRLQRT